jgi:hypothetical protein
MIARWVRRRFVSVGTVTAARRVAPSLIAHVVPCPLQRSTRNRDFIWIDFQGVGSDMEAISRAVYQLGLRQVPVALSIMAQLWTHPADSFYTYLTRWHVG